jgi:hypothetical protein
VARILLILLTGLVEHPGSGPTPRRLLRASLISIACLVDPALVMQHAWFQAAIIRRGDGGRGGADVRPYPDSPVESLLHTLEFKLNDQGRERMAMLRSMLTHLTATEQVRIGLDHQAGQIAAACPGATRGSEVP